MSAWAPYAEAIVETIRQPLVVLDEGFRVVSANPAFYQHFGAARDDTLGCPLWELGNHQWDVPALRELLDRVLPHREIVEGFEVRHVFEQLGPRVFIVNARQIELEEQRLKLILVAFEDATEQRRAERALERHTRELERSNRDLEEFAHAASHDLQEPLRKVRAFSDRLLRSLDPSTLDERQHMYAERIDSAVDRMQARIDDLLRLARVSRVRAKRRPVDLGATTARVLGDLDETIAHLEAEVDVGEMPTVEADAAQMELLLQNLIANALKYHQPGQPPRVRITAEALPEADGRQWVRITVADEGIGFEPIYAERVFRAFERLHGREEYPGSGVGLSICRRVVELHGGEIEAEGRPGAGATFAVTLPVVQREPEI